MKIKVDPVIPGRNPIMADGKIKPDWLKLFQDFPDRFVIGSDQHYGPTPPQSPSRWQAHLAASQSASAGKRVRPH
jgi:hypothetical protein